MLERLILTGRTTGRFRNNWPAKLVACSLAEVTAVILSAEQFACLGIDRDALAVGPMALADVDGIAESFQLFNRGGSEAGFEIELVREVLVMKARRIDGLLDVQAAFRC